MEESEEVADTSQRRRALALYTPRAPSVLGPHAHNGGAGPLFRAAMADRGQSHGATWPQGPRRMHGPIACDVAVAFLRC